MQKPSTPEGMDRSDVGRRVRVTSVGGLIEDHCLARLKYENKRCECNQKTLGHGRAVKGDEGVVVRGPYRITFKAKRKKLTASGKIAKNKYGKIIYVDDQFTTDPYWLVRLDCNGLHLHFSEPEIQFLD